MGTLQQLPTTPDLRRKAQLVDHVVPFSMGHISREGLVQKPLLPSLLEVLGGGHMVKALLQEEPAWRGQRATAGRHTVLLSQELWGQ